MPFVSDKQRKYLAINKPEIAKEFAMHGESDKQPVDHKKSLKKRVKDTWHGDKWKEEEKKKVDKKS